MATAQMTREPVINDVDDDFVETGDWTEDRKTVLKNIAFDEIVEEALRIQAEHPERLTIKPVTVYAEPVGA